MNLTENRAPSCRAGDGCMKKPELLSPAGNLEKLKMALIYGADAVYLGGKSFGLRAFGGNFSEAEMEEGVRFAHALGRKVYVTLNIFAHNADLERLPAYLSFLAEIHVDGLLVSDLGVFSLAREFAPSVPLHISTQANTVNWAAAEAWHKLGAARVVLAREMSRDEIREARRRTSAALEMFVHGAMCISYSGRCLISSYLTGRDANRGSCTHPCRWRYRLVEEERPGQYFPVEEDEHGTYIFNSKDLCMIDHIPELIEAGVSSLKIEGRMKSVYYVAAVVAAYRKAIDSYYELGAAFSVRPEWREELEKVSHRPYTTAFAFQNPDHSAQEYMKSQPEQPYDFIGLVLEQDKGNGTVKVQQRNYFKAGEVVECLTPAGDVFPVTIGHLTNKDGEEAAAAPHPLEELTMVTEQDLPPYTILRRRARG